MLSRILPVYQLVSKKLKKSWKYAINMDMAMVHATGGHLTLLSID